MSSLPDHSDALIVAQSRPAQERVFVGRMPLSDLGDGDVTVRVAWSSVNYKDGLVTKPGNKVARIDPIVPGVDLSGEVIASDVADIPVGAQVIVHGHDLGVSHHGGFA